jgi:diketogulonate reductase-like aldo/keto reductase
VLLRTAEELAVTANQVLLAWLTGRGIISVSGATTQEQMKQSMAAFGLPLSLPFSLSDAILDRLDRAGAKPE